MALKDSHWLRSIFGVGLGALVTLAGTGVLLWRDSAIQDQRLEVNVAAINSNARETATNAETLATLSQELPLIRQALVSNQELVGVVIEDLKGDVAMIGNRISAHISLDDGRHEAIAASIHNLEVLASVHDREHSQAGVQ